MSWIATGAMATISVVSSIEGNKQAKANAESTAKQLLTSLKVGNENIKNTARELNKQASVELTQVSLEGMKNQATTSNVIVEKEIAGAVATRLYENSDMKELLLSNQIKQKAESNMANIQTEFMNAKYGYEAGMMQNAINMNNNTKSTLEIIAGGASAGASGYMLGSAIASAK